MSIQHSCDGCKEKLDTPVQSGNVLKRDYCEVCNLRAQEFLKEEEALRVELVTHYNNGRLKLIQKFSEKDFLLPDVVYE